MNKPFILVVEDDAAIKNLIATTLETQNYRFHTAQTGAQAVKMCIRDRPMTMRVLPIMAIARATGGSALPTRTIRTMRASSSLTAT